MIELIGYRVYSHNLNEVGAIEEEKYIEGKKKQKIYKKSHFTLLQKRFRRIKKLQGLVVDFHFKEL